MNHTQEQIESKDKIDNLINSIPNYIKKGRIYTEYDLCRIYYKITKNHIPYIPGMYYPYRRDELLQLSCKRTFKTD